MDAAQLSSITDVQQLREMVLELADRDARLADREMQLADRDAKLAERDALIARYDRTIAWKTAKIDKLTREIMRLPTADPAELTRAVERQLSESGG